MDTHRASGAGTRRTAGQEDARQEPPQWHCQWHSEWTCGETGGEGDLEGGAYDVCWHYILGGDGSQPEHHLGADKIHGRYVRYCSLTIIPLPPPLPHC